MKIRETIFTIYNMKDNYGNNTIEHVIPQSVYKKNKILSRDLHNIFPLPSKVNIHRSNYKYDSDPKYYPDSKLIDGTGETVPFQSQSENKFQKNILSKTLLQRRN